MTLVSRTFDLLLKHEWGSDGRCPECRGWSRDFLAVGDHLQLPQVGDHIDHPLVCEMGDLVAQIKSQRQTVKPVLRQDLQHSPYVGPRPSDRGCVHSAQSWYIKDSEMHCSDCEG